MAAMAGFEPAILPDKGRILQREVVSVSLPTDPSCGLQLSTSSLLHHNLVVAGEVSSQGRI